MPDHDDSLGGETFDGDAQADRTEQSLGDQSTLGDSHVGDELFDDEMKLEDLSERYTEESVLGKGGFGEVILATDKRLNRKVAIKRILGKAVRSKKAVARFLIEAKSIAALSHPNIVEIYDYGRATDGPFLIMECVSGGSLLKKIKAGPLELSEAVNILSQLCNGLAKAHAAGIIHRDIKPANVLMTEDGVPKLTDFGLAKDDADDTGISLEGAVIGTLDFMPPEQRQGAEFTDHRSDLWSLAATFYQMLTGEPPRVIDLDLLPPSIRPVLAKALKSKKEDRFASAAEFKKALESTASNVIATPVKELTSGVCPACNAVNGENRKFCGECAESLRAVCLGCDIEMAVWDKICGECGGRQTDLRQQATEQTAAVTAALDKGDWKTALSLEPDNNEGIRIKAAAAEKTNAKRAASIVAALAKGDWKTTLSLDPGNIEGLRLKVVAGSVNNSIGMTLNQIPSGNFVMGSPTSENDRKNNEHQHTVKISKSFYLQTTAVTQGQWKSAMGTEPWMRWFSSKSGVSADPNYPATYVKWDDAVDFCDQLSRQEGEKYRLPTEAEWEYACRAGSTTAWSFGNDAAALGDHAWFFDNTLDIDEKHAHEVGKKNPNPFGLYDMHGNVWEWCSDFYSEHYYSHSPGVDPRGPTVDSCRVLRGGSWDYFARCTRSANRGRNVAADCNGISGFRVVRELH